MWQNVLINNYRNLKFHISSLLLFRCKLSDLTVFKKKEMLKKPLFKNWTWSHKYLQGAIQLVNKQNNAATCIGQWKNNHFFKSMISEDNVLVTCICNKSFSASLPVNFLCYIKRRTFCGKSIKILCSGNHCTRLGKCPAKRSNEMNNT